MAPADIAPEDADAFDHGVLAGQDAAINGLPLSTSCVDLNVEGPGFSGELAVSGIEAGLATWELFKMAWAGAVLSGVMFLVDLSMALETFSDNPNEALSQAATALQGQLQKMGFSEAMQLFIGGGVDTSVAGCGLLLTAIYRDQAPAAAAASGLGRARWLVASWRTDQSGGVTIVASS